VKAEAITQNTSRQILNTAWRMISESGRVDISMSELARETSVSRQTVYLAFENRAGLLAAMVQNKDDQSPEVQALAKAGQAAGGRPETLFEYTRAWLAYLPVVYPVASLLSAASLNDSAASSAWQSRMEKVRGGYLRLVQRMSDAGHLRDEWTAKDAGEFCWSLSHVENWRLLVVGCGWTPERFLDTRIAVMQDTLIGG